MFKKRRRFGLPSGLIIMGALLSVFWSQDPPRVPYRDSSLPSSRRIDDLLERMTLEEKVGQLNMPCVYEDGLGDSIQEKMQGCRSFAEGRLVTGVGPAGGFFTLANTILPVGPRQQAEFFNELQEIAINRTRLGIPLLQTEEGTHGLMCSGSTIFPEGLALGSTWNLDLIRRVYSTTAVEARPRGIHQLFTLVVEPYRDPRLGRSQEGYSEDPYYCARIARTIVTAVQGDDVSLPGTAVAGLCHYPGQSEPVSGLERGAMEVSERMLREVFLPPWIAGIRDAGALGVMATYPAIDGVPAHASARILTEVLRQELGFQGLVLSEGGGIGTLVYEGLAATQKDAGILCLTAGVDVGISFEEGYLKSLVDSVREGRIAQQLIDRAVRRVLEQKMRLGLFERPLADPGAAERVGARPEHRQLAREAAQESIVLLKNQDGLLPLSKDLGRIAVIGPNADHERNQLGDYTPKTILHDIVTILEGIRLEVGSSTRVDYVRGCDVIDRDGDEIDRAREVATGADVAIVVVGENEWGAPGKKGTSGEGYDAATLELTGLQEELVRAVVSTGTPTVVILVNGRPLAVPWIAENVPAIVEAWSCGEQGGHAVADVLFGDVSPSGRLPVSFARHAGQLPVYYNHKRSKSYWIRHGWGRPYVDSSPEPLWVFGEGLSYAGFHYEGLQIEPNRISPGGSATVTVEVTNTGRRAAFEVVQLYVRDSVASVAVSEQQLRGFSKVWLEPGERKKVSFRLGPSELALLDRHMEWVVEPGEFEVRAGHSSRDLPLRGTLEVVQ